MGKRLFEEMIEANHRALAGDTQAGLHPADYPDELPLVALTCVDARLNALLPQALGVPPEQFIWLRNAGNIITGPISSTMRSLALACAVKGGKEIVVIGHTDCQVGKTTTLQLLDSFRALGLERHMLPDNLNEFFGIFSSDRQNVHKAVDFVRNSPLIGPKVPVQGLLVDIETGKLEWLVNGYNALESAAPGKGESSQASGFADALKPLAGFSLGELRFPEGRIGEVVSTIGREILERMEPGPVPAAASPGAPPPSSSSPAIGMPEGFKLGEIAVQGPKAGQTLSSIARELAERLSRGSAGVSGPGKAAQPPKIPIPPRLLPKVHLRRNPK